MPDSPDENTADLVELAQAGDAKALDALFRRHIERLRVYIRAHSNPVLMARESDADLVQTVCREALQSLENYEWQGEGSFRYWLFTVAKNKLRQRSQHHMAEKRRPTAEEPGVDPMLGSDPALRDGAGSPSQHAVADETQERIVRALRSMPDQYREVILMSRFAGLTHAEIANRLEKNQAAVRVLLSRALARLTTEMKDSTDPTGSTDPTDPAS
jgi:RNA polymerase sigma-70 factor (subfamily 1)